MARTQAHLLITHTELADLSGLPTGLILRWAKRNAGGFPSPVRVVERTYLFNRREALAWLKIREERNGQ